MAERNIKNINEGPSSLFLDASFLISYFAKEDRHYSKSLQLDNLLEKNKIDLYTIWPMISEASTLLLYRYHRLYAMSLLNSLNAYHILLPTEQEYFEAQTLFKEWNKEQEISLNDFLARTIIRNRLDNIPVLTFDSDFSKMGLTVFKL